MKDLVAYADARAVTLIPEIETPGHSGQLRGTLPEIFGYKTADGKIESPGIINIASDEALAALDVLVGEFAAVFKSSPYVHIGCDESSVGGIEKYPCVQARMAKMGLHNAGEVFADYVNRMAAIVKKHGKQTILWQDAPIGPGTDKSMIVMAWREGSGGAANAIARGFRVIEAQSARRWPSPGRCCWARSRCSGNTPKRSPCSICAIWPRATATAPGIRPKKATRAASSADRRRWSRFCKGCCRA